MARPSFLRVLAGIVVAVVGSSCSGCPDSPGTDDAETEDCTFASCEAQCRSVALCYGSCSGGVCHCMSCGTDADVRLDGEADVTREDSRDVEEIADVEQDDGRDVAGCEHVITGETRAGASPGVTCRRLSVDEVEKALLHFSGSGDRVAFSGGEVASALWEVRLGTGCIAELDNAESPIPDRYAVNTYPSVEGDRVAYVAEWMPTPDILHCELRLLDLTTANHRVLVPSDSVYGAGRACSMDHVALEYPWIVWRDVREHPLGAGPETVGLYNSDAVGLNVETGEIVNLSLEPLTGLRVWGGVIKTDLHGAWAVFNAGWRDGTGMLDPVHEEIVAVNLVSGDRRQITDVPGDQYFPTITVPWVAWTDTRCCAGDCDSMSPCSNDIYGYNLETREEHALVVAGDTMQGDQVDGEGPWLLYEDQRGGDDPTRDGDREEDIFAFHLPTRTEIRITDWPGYEMLPRVYRREDGSYGALFVHEISYHYATYRLWDCDLPEPSTP